MKTKYYKPQNLPIPKAEPITEKELKKSVANLTEFLTTPDYTENYLQY